MKQIAIFAATRWELEAIRRALPGANARHEPGLRWLQDCRGALTIHLVQTGVGPHRAEEVARAVLALEPVDILLSAGFACALRPTQIGAVLVGTDVRRVGDFPSDPIAGEFSALPIAADRDVTARVLDAAHAGRLTSHAGPFVSVSRILCRAAEKRAVAERTGAIAADMESAALGAVAGERGLPFAIVRTASDLLDEDLPLDFNRFQGARGWVWGMAACLVQPHAWLGLSRLRRQAKVAADRLTRVFERYVEALT